MCELLALSSSTPARLTFSLATLAARGGAAGSSHEGWGVAFYQGCDVALFREPAAAADSALVHFLETEGPATRLAISHIRHATQGGVSLANTQPFVRELGGRTHVFAHNGNLPGIYRNEVLALGSSPGRANRFRACVLRVAGAPARTVDYGGTPPTVELRLSLLTAFASDLRELGPANFLYSDGDALFAHGHRRMQINSKRADPPGLWIRQRLCAPADPVSDDRGCVSVR